MSTEYMDVIWIVLLAADLVLAGSSRLFHCIRIVALQGILLGVLMLLSHGLSAETFAWQTVLTALIQGGIKGGLLPNARWGYPEDIGDAVSAFCSDKFLYSTGNYIDLDGGMHIKRL